MSDNPLASLVISEMKDAGIEGKLVSQEYSEQHFGNAIVDVRVERVLLRFIRDRSIDELMLASTFSPTKFYPFVDVQIAMGWKSVEDVVTKQGVPSLKDAVHNIKLHLDAVQNALTEDQGKFDKAGLERLARQGFLPHTGGRH